MPGQTVFIIAGEASGDLHASHLARKLLTLDPGLKLKGMGGDNMRRAGVDIMIDASDLAVVGLFEVLANYRTIKGVLEQLKQTITKTPPDLLILVDYQEFNQRLAAYAKSIGVKVLFYIGPQVWAWRSGRVKKIGRLTKRVGVILPFEKDFYAARGVEVDFVGHPLVDTVKPSRNKEEFLRSCNIELKPDTRIVGILPGSRSKEIRSLLPDFLAAAHLLTCEKPEKYIFLLPRASTVSRQLLAENGLADYQDKLRIHTTSDNRYDLMAACDAVVTASGTVTLELAILGIPAVTTYRVSPRTYRIGRLLIRHIKYFSLVNLIADRQVIPELLQDEVTPENIAERLQAMLNDSAFRKIILQGLAEVTEKLGAPGCSKRAAEIAIECMTG